MVLCSSRAGLMFGFDFDLEFEKVAGREEEVRLVGPSIVGPISLGTVSVDRVGGSCAVLRDW